jgi:hypothetical protein
MPGEATTVEKRIVLENSGEFHLDVLVNVSVVHIFIGRSTAPAARCA